MCQVLVLVEAKVAVRVQVPPRRYLVALLIVVADCIRCRHDDHSAGLQEPRRPRLASFMGFEEPLCQLDADYRADLLVPVERSTDQNLWRLPLLAAQVEDPHLARTAIARSRMWQIESLLRARENSGGSTGDARLYSPVW